MLSSQLNNWNADIKILWRSCSAALNSPLRKGTVGCQFIVKKLNACMINHPNHAICQNIICSIQSSLISCNCLASPPSRAHMLSRAINESAPFTSFPGSQGNCWRRILSVIVLSHRSCAMCQASICKSCILFKHLPCLYRKLTVNTINLKWKEIHDFSTWYCCHDIEYDSIKSISKLRPNNWFSLFQGIHIRKTTVIHFEWSNQSLWRTRWKMFTKHSWDVLVRVPCMCMMFT